MILTLHLLAEFHPRSESIRVRFFSLSDEKMSFSFVNDGEATTKYTIAHGYTSYSESICPFGRRNIESDYREKKTHQIFVSCIGIGIR